MALKGRAERLIRQATKDMVRIDLRDGTTRVFDDMEVFKRCSRQNELSGEGPAIRDLRGRTRRQPRAAILRGEYGPICKVAASSRPTTRRLGGRVQSFEDGTVEKRPTLGGSEGAERIRRRRYSKAQHSSPRRRASA